VAGDADLVAAQLRAADRDRYLAVLYAPADRRAALNALYAFDAEIGALRARARDALPGEIRLQWWRDRLAGDGIASDAIAGGAATSGSATSGPTGNPLADELLRAIGRHNLPRAAFDAYLEARIFDLYDDPMPSRTDLEGYCGETASAIIQLAALILEPQAAQAASELAGHAGCAEAMVRILRDLPAQRRRGQCYFPRDMLAAAGTTPESFNAQADAAAQTAVAAMIALAQEHLQHFEAVASRLSPALRPAFLPAALARARLRTFRRPADLLAGTRDLPAWRRQWTLFRTASRGWGAPPT
jgi:phytoene synthase